MGEWKNPEHPPARPANRSLEELEMRSAVEAWGRQRWPTARVVHELVVGQRRIDMAFVTQDHLAGVEIKSSRDVFDRCDGQLTEFSNHIPEVWLAMAPKWIEDSFGVAKWGVGKLVCLDGEIHTTWRNGEGKTVMYSHPARRSASITVPMLSLLWRSELHAVSARAGIRTAKGKPARPVLIAELARKLTGDEIVAGVCRELRARDAFWKADPVVRIEGIAATSPCGHPDLFRGASPHG